MENRDLALTAFALQKGYSLVLMKEGKLIATKQGRGIRPLLELIEEDKGQLQGAYLGDKIFGRAAAFLAAYARFAGVYARVISKPALDILRKYGIEVAFALQVPAILNREETGLCPMETLSATFNRLEEAPGKIREKLRELQQPGLVGKNGAEANNS